MTANHLIQVIYLLVGERGGTGSWGDQFQRKEIRALFLSPELTQRIVLEFYYSIICIKIFIHNTLTSRLLSPNYDLVCQSKENLGQNLNRLESTESDSLRALQT